MARAENNNVVYAYWKMNRKKMCCESEGKKEMTERGGVTKGKMWKPEQERIFKRQQSRKDVEGE